MSTLSAEGLEAVLGSIGVESAVPIFAGADLQRDPMSIFVSYLAETLAQLTDSEPDLAFGAIQWPSDEGDLVIILPKLRLKNIDAKVCASQLVLMFPASPLYAHPFNEGHTLRFFLNSGNLAYVLLPYIIDRGASYGTDQIDSAQESIAPSKQREKVVVEFSSPNLGQEFSGDHLRSTIIGAFIASIYESMGWDVFRINFLGDWGKHIGLLAVAWAKFHSDDLFIEDPLRHLLDIYTKVKELFDSEQEVVKEAPKTDSLQAASEPINQDRDAFFKRMEDGESDALALWNRFRESCVSTYTDLYARLGIEFDEYSGESKLSPETVVEVEAILKDKGIVREEDGARSIDFENNGYRGLGSPKIRYWNGTTTYLLRDIATTLERHRKHCFDKMIYVVTGKQDLHFHQIIAGLELVGHSELASKLQHINFGRVRGLVSDMGSSGLLLGDILDRCQKAVSTFLEMDHGDTYSPPGGEPLIVANSLACSALMTQELSVKRGANFNFDLNDMATLNPYNGLSLQSWLSKISLKLKGVMVPYQALSSLDYSIFEQDEYEAFADVLRLLVQFPGTVKHSFRTLESSHVLTLLFRVTDLLPDVWAADIDNQTQEVEKWEADHADPSNITGAKPMDHFETARVKQQFRGDATESSLLKPPLQTGPWVSDDRLPKTERGGEHLEALEHSRSSANSLKNDDTQQQLGQSHQEGDEETEAQIDGPLEKPDVETPLHDENPQAVHDDRSVVRVFQEEAPPSKEEHLPGSTIEGDETPGTNGTDKAGETIGEVTIQGPQETQGCSENEKQKISRTRDDGIFQQGITLNSAEAEEYKQEKILGIDQQSMLQDPEDEGLKHEPLTPCNIQGRQRRQRKNSGILLGEEEIQQEATRDEDSSENTLQEDASENVLVEKALTIGEEDKGKGKGKERADQADEDLQLSPERFVKLAFYECVRQVLENGMRMVGLVPLEV